MHDGMDEQQKKKKKTFPEVFFVVFVLVCSCMLYIYKTCMHFCCIEIRIFVTWITHHPYRSHQNTHTFSNTFTFHHHQQISVCVLCASFEKIYFFLWIFFARNFEVTCVAYWTFWMYYFFPNFKFIFIFLQYYHYWLRLITSINRFIQDLSNYFQIFLVLFPFFLTLSSIIDFLSPSS